MLTQVSYIEEEKYHIYSKKEILNFNPSIGLEIRRETLDFD